MIILDNALLRVELYDFPAVKSYFHKGVNKTIGGTDGKGAFAVNGRKVSWSEWEIEVTTAACDTAIYKMYWPETGIGFVCSVCLKENMLEISVGDIVEKKELLKTLEWVDLPLLTCKEPEYSYWREKWSQRPWDRPVGKGLYSNRNESGKIGAAIPDCGNLPSVHACFFDESICCFIYSNYPHMPILDCLKEEAGTPGRSRGFSLSPNKYQYHIRDNKSEQLCVKVVFLEDINGDGRTDECDYRLWLNRQFPTPKQLYRDSIMYKIGCAVPGRVKTTFKQALDIIRAIHNITGGMKQIVYLVGWQYDGHDTGYPSLDKINGKLGSREELIDLVKTAKENYNCIVSYHINVDDSYMEHPGWNADIICRDPGGSPVAWELFNGKQSYHICHTKDIESGEFFKRVEAMAKLVPLEETVHIDAFRPTNCSWEPGGYIGVPEELLCGVKPIIEYFSQMGVDVTTEAVDSFGVEPAGLFSAIWHMYDPQLYHGKILGGGRGTDTTAFGLGTSCDIDIDYDVFLNHWDVIADQIFLGTVLYQLYLTREMTELRIDDTDETVKLRFGTDLKTLIDRKEDRLEVKLGDDIIARDGDRFIPLGDSIYVYSREGGSIKGRLPREWEGSGFEAVQLTPGGKSGKVEYSVAGSQITIWLEPRIPVKLTKQQAIF